MSQESQELLYHIIKQEADAAKKTSSVFSPFDSNNSDIPVLVSRVLTFLIHILFNENINQIFDKSIGMSAIYSSLK